MECYSEQTCALAVDGELGADEATVLADQTIRDQRDTERAHSPLQAAPDAHTIDTTDLTLDQVVARVVELVRSAR